MLGLQLISTRFPYTALFRSMMVAPSLYRVASTPLLVTACAVANAVGLTLAATAGGLTQLAIGYGVLFGLGGGDRKSTRLNSSHGYSSYAVFCLKKKNHMLNS